MGYCARDVVATHRVFESVWPKFQSRCLYRLFLFSFSSLTATFLWTPEFLSTRTRPLLRRARRFDAQVRAPGDVRRNARDECAVPAGERQLARFPAEHRSHVSPDAHAGERGAPTRRRRVSLAAASRAVREPTLSTFCRLHQHKIVNKIRNLNTLACHPVRMVWSAECAYIYNILLSISIFSNISNTVFYVFGLNSFLSLLANAISHTLEKNGASSLTSCSYTDLNATIRIPSNVKTTPHLLCTLKIKLSQTTS